MPGLDPGIHAAQRARRRSTDDQAKGWKFEFGPDDAKIVVPIVLLVVAVTTTSLPAAILIGLVAAYYLLYFFLKGAVTAIKGSITMLKMRCPNCGNRKIILQGYQGYKSNEHYPYYFCDNCKTTSTLTDGGLLQI